MIFVFMFNERVWVVDVCEYYVGVVEYIFFKVNVVVYRNVVLNFVVVVDGYFVVNEYVLVYWDILINFGFIVYVNEVLYVGVFVYLCVFIYDGVGVDGYGYKVFFYCEIVGVIFFFVGGKGGEWLDFFEEGMVIVG